MLYQKFVDAWDNMDAEAELELFHKDWEFKFHSSGKIMKKGDITTADRKKMMENIRQSERADVLDENDDILVMHSISHFPNDTSDAVMMVHIKKDGLLWRTETGSPLPLKD